MLRQALKMSMGQAAPLGFFPPDADEFSFVTEVFFLAHRAISSCLLPLWSEMTEQVHLLYDLSGPRGQKLDEPSQRRINLHGDGWACARWRIRDCWRTPGPLRPLLWNGCSIN